MNNFLVRFFTVLSVLAIFTMLIHVISCDGSSSKKDYTANDTNSEYVNKDTPNYNVLNSRLIGDWELNPRDSGIQGKISIKNESVDLYVKYLGMDVHALMCEIFEVSDENGTMESGYLIIKIKDGMYLVVDEDAKNKFMVLRWKKLNTFDAEFSFSSIENKEKFDYKDTVEGARLLLTNTKSCFNRNLIVSRK